MMDLKMEKATRIFFLLVHILPGEVLTENGSLTLTKIPDMVSLLCPGVNICGRYTELNHLPVFSMNDDGPCCMECSCKPDCGANGNCCFPPEKGIENKQNIEALHRNQECIHPTTRDLDEETKILFYSYNMITSVMTEHNSSLSCGEKQVAIWGSLYPVYSASKQQIYTNMACAKADKVYDGEVWDVYLSCKMDIGQSSSFKVNKEIDHNYFIDLAMNNGFNSSMCHVNFWLNDFRIRKLQCLDKVIDTCPNQADMLIPYGLNFSAEEIRSACTSGFRSPYRQKKMYSNVYCHICNGEGFVRDAVCPKLKSVHSGRAESKVSSFLGLIHAEFFSKKKKKQTNGPVSFKLACKFDHNNGCRPVHCPSGQFFDKFGNCKPMIRVWYNRIAEVILNLKTAKKIDIVKLTVLKNRVIAPATKLPNNWLLTTLVYDKNSGEINGTSVQACLVIKENPIRITHVLSTLKRLLKEYWFVKDEMVTYIFKVSINHFDLDTQFETDYIRIDNRTLHVALPNLINLLSSTIVVKFIPGVTNLPLQITRLYLCNQIELTNKEFILSENRHAILNLITQNVMLNYEFKLINDEIRGMRVRVCIEDSGFLEKNRGTSLMNETYLFVFSIFAIALNLFFKLY